NPVAAEQPSQRRAGPGLRQQVVLFSPEHRVGSCRSTELFYSRSFSRAPPMPTPDRFLLAGVMGWPVMHSRSPLLHNYFFKQHRLAGAYVPLAIQPDCLQRALRALAPLGFSGCNLTIPHKERALAIVDEVDDLARRIGAISCVVARPDGSLAGTNNDVHGFARNILQQQPAWRADAGPAVVIGAGG